MSALILVIYGKEADELLNLDTLVNLQRLMSMGAFGRIKTENEAGSPAGRRFLEIDVWESFNLNGKAGLWLTDHPPVSQPPAPLEIMVTDWENNDPKMMSHNRFNSALSWMRGQDWNICIVEDHGLQYPEGSRNLVEYLHMIDEGLGLLFESLTDDTIVAVLIRPAEVLTGFILAAPFAEPTGEALYASESDLAATLLHLLGLVSGETSEGRLVLRRDRDPGQAGGSLSQDEEAILRERLSGLGYL
jgi:hypothetical protein